VAGKSQRRTRNAQNYRFPTVCRTTSKWYPNAHRKRIRNVYDTCTSVVFFFRSDDISPSVRIIRLVELAVLFLRTVSSCRRDCIFGIIPSYQIRKNERDEIRTPSARPPFSPRSVFRPGRRVVTRLSFVVLPVRPGTSG